MSEVSLNRRSLLRGILTVGAAGATMSLAGCAPGTAEVIPSDDHAEDIGAIVSIVDNFYVPDMTAISAGQAVQWVWESTDRHDVVGDDHTFVSELQYEGQYTHIFEEPGEYSYRCSIHPEMRGIITVT